MSPLSKHASSWRTRSIRDSSRSSKTASTLAAAATASEVTSQPLPPLPPVRDLPAPEKGDMPTRTPRDDTSISPTAAPPSPPSQSRSSRSSAGGPQSRALLSPQNGHTDVNGGGNGVRKVRSQYPASSTENHVEYILVASFDIDRGSVMEHQYPGPISGDENMLAELMLPDQAHMRNQDWTVFFLHKDTSAEDEAKEARRERRALRREMLERKRLREETGEGVGTDGEDDLEWEDDGEDDGETSEEDYEDEMDGPPLIYVLNLVNTKQDNTVKRGAVVKAMAICTRHSFLHIYKPLLLLALEEYFRAPVPATLAALYNAVNSMDLSLLPRLNSLERQILQASDAKDMFMEKFQQMLIQRKASNDLSPQDNSANLAITQFKEPTLPRDTHEFESRVVYNGIPIPIRVPTAVSPETVGDFSLVQLVQTFAGPHSSSPQPFALHPHLTTNGAFTHPIIVLLNALLTQKRIVFLGHNMPSGSVADAVLAACALASGSGLLRGFTRHAFPYTDLTKIDDLLKVPGFIAGVTNPAFAMKPEWWDLLCDLPTGRMKISHRIEGAPVTEGLLFFQQPQVQQTVQSASSNSSTSSSSSGGAGGKDDATGDVTFMQSILEAIANRRGEAHIRARFAQWVRHFVRISASFEELVYGASNLTPFAHLTDTDSYGYGVAGHGFVWPSEAERLKELNANVSRIEGWRVTRSYFACVADLARGWERGDGVRGLDIAWCVDRLKGLKLGEQGSAGVYLALWKAVEEAPETDIMTPFLGADDDEDEDEDEGLTMKSKSRIAGAALMSPGGTSRSVQRDPAAAEKRRYDTINLLLAHLPESQGGLFCLSLGLFHPRLEVRKATVELIERIAAHEAGRHFWASLSRFAKVGWLRVRREIGGTEAEA